MRRTVLPLALLVLAALAPVRTAASAPAVPETNPVGTLRWLPDNTNETPPPGMHRLVVIYDRSIDAAGKPSSLLAKGAFGLKFATGSPDFRMKSHSPAVESLSDSGGPSMSPLDEAFAAVAGDVRDGDCSRAGTSAFSAAFTSTKIFIHYGPTPYVPQSGPGACEVVSSSIPVAGGFQTRVTTHVPGFWIDIDWPGATGQLLAEVWYEAAFDTQGESGAFYQTADAAGTSRSVGRPT